MLKSLSWGVGLQSTTLLEMSANGDLPKLDVAIFADTGFEHDYSYEIFDFYAPRAKAAGIEVIKISGQDILQAQYQHVDLPLFIAGSDRMIKRKCTRDFKIRPIQRQLRDVLGVKRRGRLPADLVELWLGITVDEIHRAKDSRVAYIRHEFPLLDKNFYREDCITYLAERGLPVPGKSSCVFCPYKKQDEWEDLISERPEEYRQIAKLELHINQNGMVKIGGQSKQVTFRPNIQADLSGMCDGGFCHN